MKTNILFQGLTMEDGSIQEQAIKNLTTIYDQRTPKTLDQLDKLGQNLENLSKQVGRKVGQTFERVAPNSLLDSISYESERLRSHSEHSSRRNSDDGGRARQEGFRHGKFRIYPGYGCTTNFFY